eukprot:135350-Pelagomonas_calceolata.AAC.2
MSIVRQRHVAITSHRARARESKKGCIFGIFGMLPTSAGPFLFADSPIASNSCFVIRWTADKQGIKLVRAVTSCVQLHCNVRAVTCFPGSWPDDKKASSSSGSCCACAGSRNGCTASDRRPCQEERLPPSQGCMAPWLAVSPSDWRPVACNMAPWRLWDLDPWLLLGCPAAVLASASGGAGALWGGSVGALCCIAGAARFAACGRRGIARAGPLSTGRAVLVEWVCAGGARVVAAANARPGHGPCVAGVIAESGPAAFASCGSCCCWPVYGEACALCSFCCCCCCCCCCRQAASKLPHAAANSSETSSSRTKACAAKGRWARLVLTEDFCTRLHKSQQGHWCAMQKQRLFPQCKPHCLLAFTCPN